MESHILVVRRCTMIFHKRLGIRSRLSGISLAKTLMILIILDRSVSTSRSLGLRADIEPRSGQETKKAALDEMVIKINCEKYYLLVMFRQESMIHVMLGSTGGERRYP